ncbi:hypothetical protein ILYODFUR_038919 [Ilyodon furcidens]|uniref:Uncharacterized protein n=1 Tax=Ilyodon furcidens TaxID=33524 RepID=A0ABV0T485_9TELE
MMEGSLTAIANDLRSLANDIDQNEPNDYLHFHFALAMEDFNQLQAEMDLISRTLPLEHQHLSATTARQTVSYNRIFLKTSLTPRWETHIGLYAEIAAPQMRRDRLQIATPEKYDGEIFNKKIFILHFLDWKLILKKNWNFPKTMA